MHLIMDPTSAKIDKIKKNFINVKKISLSLNRQRVKYYIEKYKSILIHHSKTNYTINSTIF